MRNYHKPLIWLASASPRRSALLDQIGVSHRVRAMSVDEQVLPGETPLVYVERLAVAKATALAGGLAASEIAPVLAADTAVVVGASILGKPRDRADGLRMLALLSNRTHQVYTAVALHHADRCECRTSVSDVAFRALSAQEMSSYWDSGEPADKAGGYAIQGIGARFIERMAGSYSGIVGLPLFETAQLLDRAGWRWCGREEVLAAEGLPG